jgi:predicted histone-like DNA-binding protein
MALFYKTVSTFRPGEGREGRKLWFPKLTGSSKINQKEIAEIIALRSTASGGDVYLIVKALVDLIPELLADGKTVRLEDLGTFRLHAKVTTSDSAEEVSAKNIRELRISFIPDKSIKDELKKVKFAPAR